MHRKDVPSIAYIYENDDIIKGNFGKEITDSTQGKSSEYTGTKMNNYNNNTIIQ